MKSKAKRNTMGLISHCVKKKLQRGVRRGTVQLEARGGKKDADGGYARRLSRHNRNVRGRVSKAAGTFHSSFAQQKMKFWNDLPQDIIVIVRIYSALLDVQNTPDNLVVFLTTILSSR